MWKSIRETLRDAVNIRQLFYPFFVNFSHIFNSIYSRINSEYCLWKFGLTLNLRSTYIKRLFVISVDSSNCNLFSRKGNKLSGHVSRYRLHEIIFLISWQFREFTCVFFQFLESCYHIVSFRDSCCAKTRMLNRRLMID